MQEFNSETSAQQAQQVASVFKSINLMSVGVAVLLSGGMVIDQHSVTVSVLSGVGFYGAVASLLVLWQPGALPYVLVNRQHEITERKRDQLQYNVELAHTPRARLTDPLQLSSTLPAALTDNARFVPAVPRISPTIKVAAASWVTQLFDTGTGRPLANRITPNKKQVQLKSPEPEVVEYLVALGIVSQDTNRQLYWDSDHFPTMQEAVNAIRTGVKTPSV